MEFSQFSLPPEHQICLNLPVMQVQSCGMINKPDQSHRHHYKAMELPKTSEKMLAPGRKVFLSDCLCISLGRWGSLCKAWLAHPCESFVTELVISN